MLVGRQEGQPDRKRPVPAAVPTVLLCETGADLTGGATRAVADEAPGRASEAYASGAPDLNFGLQLQSPDSNLNWIYDLFKLETSALIRRSVLSEF